MAIIQLKRSEVPAQQPTASDLDVGELAVNLEDGKLYTKKSNGSVIELLGGSSTDISPNNVSISGVLEHGAPSFNTKQYVLYGTTTSSTEAEVLSTGSSRVPVATDTTCFYEVSVVARRTDAVGESGAWHLKGCADNFSDTVSDVGDMYEIAVAQDNLNWQVDVRADDINNSIGIYVTGDSSQTIRWTAIVKTIEVAQ
jgi:hypothetical protein